MQSAGAGVGASGDQTGDSSMLISRSASTSVPASLPTSTSAVAPAAPPAQAAAAAPVEQQVLLRRGSPDLGSDRPGHVSVANSNNQLSEIPKYSARPKTIRKTAKHPIKSAPPIFLRDAGAVPTHHRPLAPGPPPAPPYLHLPHTVAQSLAQPVVRPVSQTVRPPKGEPAKKRPKLLQMPVANPPNRQPTAAEVLRQNLTVIQRQFENGGEEAAPRHASNSSSPHRLGKMLQKDGKLGVTKGQFGPPRKMASNARYPSHPSSQTPNGSSNRTEQPPMAVKFAQTAAPIPKPSTNGVSATNFRRTPEEPRFHGNEGVKDFWTRTGKNNLSLSPANASGKSSAGGASRAVSSPQDPSLNSTFARSNQPLVLKMPPQPVRPPPQVIPIPVQAHTRQPPPVSASDCLGEVSSFDSLIYGQAGAATPPVPIIRVPSFPRTKKKVEPPEDEPVFLGIDPRIHYPQPHSALWLEEKANEIRARGGRKAAFGKTAERLQQQLSRRKQTETFEDRLPDKIVENPAWLSMVKQLHQDAVNSEPSSRSASAVAIAPASAPVVEKKRGKPGPKPKPRPQLTPVDAVAECQPQE
ncbi:hypothetical protein B0H63DRAFT_525156 [Podospora didyma]|uniref:Uncharacterized protein n=1 Tax=Podospora didyma TaxID=330526 RepID=A0AAE0KKS0_9PEZI|nr:hypothetical protein B0H63DRAFT_525156 [Podospora didyma]